MDTSIWLSAGVIVSFITGVFSLVISFNNNKKMLDLEKFKQKSSLSQERYKNLHSLLKQILNKESILDSIPNDVRKARSDHIVATFQAAEKRYNELKRLYDEWVFLFSINSRVNIEKSIEEIDKLTKQLMSNIENPDNVSNNDINKRILLIYDFNKEIIAILQKELEELTNM